jgi:hypothetical protein
MKTAHVTQVPFGNGTIEGLMFEDGSFAVAIPQAAGLFSVRQDNAQRDFKALLGKGFQFVKAKTELNPKAVNCISLLDFERLLAALDRKEVNQMKSAHVTQVPFGNGTIEGLMFEDGSFAVAVPQVADLFMTDRNTASRDFKRLLGESFKTSKAKTEFNKNATNCISLLDFERLLAALDRKGNTQAQQLRDSLVGMSLTQLFSDAFGVKFEAEDRQSYLKQRQTHKKQFHPLYTRWAKADGCSSGRDYIIRVAQLKKLAGLPSNLSVNDMDEDALDAINNMERIYDSYRLNLGMSHEDVVKVLGS